MTDGIGRIFGGNSGYSTNFGAFRKDEETKNNKPQAPVNNYEQTQVDPSKVMDFLSANNLYVAPAEKTPVSKVDAETEARIAGFMENFEEFYAVIANEVGEEFAPDVMDMAMDKLIGSFA